MAQIPLTDIDFLSSLSVSFPSEMLGECESEDLLQQLSSELGLPELITEDDSRLCEQLIGETSSISNAADAVPSERDGNEEFFGFVKTNGSE